MTRLLPAKSWIAVTAGLSLGALLFAAKFWDEKPYTEWTQEQALSILNRSPWVDEQTFGPSDGSSADVSLPSAGTSSGLEQPGMPGSGTFGEMSGTPPVTSSQIDHGKIRRYTVRLHSAAPVRMALVRLLELRGKASASEGHDFVHTPPFGGAIVLSLSVPDTERPDFERLTTDQLRPFTFLGLKKSKARLPLERYLAPSQSGGDPIFLFGRAPEGKAPVSLSEEEIRFVTRINPQTEIDAKFNLKNMLVKGKLEL